MSLWVRDSELADSTRSHRENKAYLPGLKLPESVRVHSRLKDALSGAQLGLGAMPSAHARAVYGSAIAHANAETTFVSATKALEPVPHLRVSEVVAQVISR